MYISKLESTTNSNNNIEIKHNNNNNNVDKTCKEMSINYDYEGAGTTKERFHICCSKCTRALSHSINIV